MDPYVKMLNLMKRKGAESNPLSICIAKVNSPPPEIIIQTNDLQLYKDDLYIADYLLSGYSRQASVANTDGTAVSFLDTIKIGDELAVLPTKDNQTWIILCKVVKCSG
ncbi:DUF2577 domain-containing protein [Clostridium beijerinckii]|uniref:DUF2577 domain-containing protein n=1 Tax=Clostridium beijerinckii TaxID=1520 RepID=A0A1W7LRX2_CLOBE|nr:DUF2577 domain-containing protein [Clostridium beijerinckii]MBA8934032.1 hypothetical protein [Clostridium beijerinckii]NMF06510.1 DUF2577 domain-containing protein [Clostridium beijerinckii]NRT86538.1 hypothetical protein [Clostridium beijerinckii]NRU38226.1 hypothetical protein [Clostridium beijerinckii]NSA98496.1 hypothetical protein [Clostridium beijerinckii]